MIQYSTYRFMVIDDQSATRESMRLSIQAMGGLRVDYSTTYGDAIFRLRNMEKPPDIILCDYDLGGDRDGQQLFEEIRRESLISERTIFLMITAERAYAQVVSVVELVPDDYLLKPFTPARLSARLDKVVEKKMFFSPFFAMKGEGDLPGALDALTALAQSPRAPRYHHEILRRRAETLLSSGLYHEALKQYATILEIMAFPWARAGLAMAYHLMGLNHEALQEIDHVVTTSPQYFAAYDLKAKIYTATGNVLGAQKMLSQVSQQTPKNYARKRHLAEIALLNGDHPLADKLLAEVIVNDKTTSSNFVSEKLLLARSWFLSEHADDSLPPPLCVLSLEEIEQLTPEQERSYAALCALNGDSRHFQELRTVFFGITDPSGEIGIDVIAAALHTNDVELAELVAERLLLTPETAKTFTVILCLFRREGKEDTFRSIQKRVADMRVARNRLKAA